MPRELTIQLGDTVTFVNKSNRPIWPASNIHPDHSIYPEFDPKRPLEPGEEWSFTFTKEGRWRFHDHLNSLHEGVVTVGDGTATREGEDGRCDDAANKVACWGERVEYALAGNNVEAAFNVVAELYEKEPQLAGGCHGYAHLIGEKAYDLFSQGYDFELTPKTAYCGYGFFHGFMETLLHTTGDLAEARAFCAYVNEKLRYVSSGAASACNHGIGHGAVDGSDPRAWGDPYAMMKPGMDLCRALAKEDKPSYGSPLYLCITGVYNALEILSMDDRYRLEALREDPFAFCEREQVAYQEGCYTNMLPALLRLTNNDVMQSARLVEAIPEEGDSYEIRSLVILSLTHEYIRLHMNDANYTEEGIALCRQLADRSHLPCIRGLSGGHMKYGKPGEEYVKMIAFCTTPTMRPDERDACFEYVFPLLRLWYPQGKVEEICTRVELPYRSYCPR
ncbi:MAG: hypothetical protein WD850_00725 [Candidatus Spechtbacterales bacterium]